MNRYINFSWQLCAFCAAVALLLIGCTPDPLPSSPCISGDCQARMEFPTPKDENGYYHVDLEWGGTYYPYFNLDVYASKLRPEFEYNGIQLVEANFDSDYTWTYNSYEVNIAQNSTIRFTDKGDPNFLYSRRTLGPFPPQSEGDTISLVMEVWWEGDPYPLKTFREKFIVK